MKFMMNGAVTVGTMDGANCEIHDAVGDDNIFIFGLRADEVEEGYSKYRASEIYETNPSIRRAMDQLINGELCPENHQLFQELYHALLFGDNGGMADPYFVLKDLPSFLSTQRRVGEAYLDRDKWLKMAVINTAKSGIFAADRTIAEYNEKNLALGALGAVIFHDSRDARFRFPGGARPLGETVRLSVRADGAKSATLRL